MVEDDERENPASNPYVTTAFCNERFQRLIDKLDVVDEKVTEIRDNNKAKSRDWRGLMFGTVGSIVSGVMVAVLIMMLLGGGVAEATFGGGGTWNVVVSGLTGFGGGGVGIMLVDVSAVEVAGIYITHWNQGLVMKNASHCQIHSNIFDRNVVAVNVSASSHNVFFANNFLDNYVHVTGSAENVWNTSYPKGGNYWSEFNPPDVLGGPFQNISGGGDGIGDVPYVIDEDNVDWYPLVYPYGFVPSADIDGDNVVNILDMLCVAVSFGCVCGDCDWNPLVDAVQDGVINVLDILCVAVEFGDSV